MYMQHLFYTSADPCCLYLHLCSTSLPPLPLSLSHRNPFMPMKTYLPTARAATKGPQTRCSTAYIGKISLILHGSLARGAGQLTAIFDMIHSVHGLTD